MLKMHICLYLWSSLIDQTCFFRPWFCFSPRCLSLSSWNLALSHFLSVSLFFQNVAYTSLPTAYARRKGLACRGLVVSPGATSYRPRRAGAQIRPWRGWGVASSNCPPLRRLSRRWAVFVWESQRERERKRKAAVLATLPILLLRCLSRKYKSKYKVVGVLPIRIV